MRSLKYRIVYLVFKVVYFNPKTIQEGLLLCYGERIRINSYKMYNFKKKTTMCHSIVLVLLILIKNKIYPSFYTIKNYDII